MRDEGRQTRDDGAVCGSSRPTAGDEREGWRRDGAPSPLAPRPSPLDATRLNRIRWRCRRGMLENDLVLTRFLDARGPMLGEDEIAMLDRLLAMPDNELWDLIAGREPPPDPAVAPLVAQLRAA